MNGGKLLEEYMNMKNNGKHAEAKTYLDSLSLDGLSDIHAYVKALDYYFQRVAYERIVDGGESI